MANYDNLYKTGQYNLGASAYWLRVTNQSANQSVNQSANQPANSYPSHKDKLQKYKKIRNIQKKNSLGGFLIATSWSAFISLTARP